jgi:hypothetical protein
MFRLLSGIFKIAVVSLLTGVALSALDVSAADMLEGLRPHAGGGVGLAVRAWNGPCPIS